MTSIQLSKFLRIKKEKHGHSTTCHTDTRGKCVRNIKKQSRFMAQVACSHILPELTGKEQ